MSAALLGNDLVINENDCNLGCTYCLTGQSNLKQSHLGQPIFGTPKRDRYGGDTPLGQRVDAIIDRVAAAHGAPLLKITGGEVFLVENLLALVEKAAARFPSVLLQSNGILMRPDHLDRLALLPNVTLQLSLDSHLHSGNSHRIARADLHDKALARIAAILERGLAVEIYTVITDRNAEQLVGFAEWLAAFGTRLQMLPFPVRGPDTGAHAIRPEQIAGIEALAEAHGRLAEVLPPKPYLDRLLRFYREGGRRFRCHLPRLVVSTFSDGMVTACPNIWFSDLGSALADDWSETSAAIGETPLYKALLADRPRLAACKGCFTPWDMLSMYLDGEVTLDEVCAGPAYSAPEVRAWLERAKAELTAGEGAA